MSFLIIDGHSLAYRAFYSVPATLTLFDQQPLNAVYGFTTLFFKAWEQFQPQYLCVCFDRQEPTFRHLRYPAYKAHRPPSPPEFHPQLPILRALLKKMGVPTCDLAGFEADDLLGTLARFAGEQQISAQILTGDRDALQLVSEQTQVLLTKKGVSDLAVFTPQAVWEKYHLRPEQLISLKALQGDPSDNIPGVPGIGEKTAQRLLAQFPSLAALYANVDQIVPEKLRQVLIDHTEVAHLSLELATINCQVPLAVSLAEFSFQPHWPQILDSFKEYGFQSLFNRYSKRDEAQLSLLPMATPSIAALDPALPQAAPAKPGVYQALTSSADLLTFLPQLQNGFALDLETTHLQPQLAQIVGMSFAVQEAEAFYLPLNQYLQSTAASTQLALFEVNEPAPEKLSFALNPLLALLKPLLENPAIPKFTHNGKFEYRVLRNYGIELQGLQFDTLLAAYLLYPGQPLSLKDLVRRLFQYQMTTYAGLTTQGREQIPFQDIPLAAATAYAAADADFTFRLKNFLAPQLPEKGLAELFYQIEMPTQTVLAKMESTGVALDVAYLATLDSAFQTRLSALAEQIFGLTGQRFNLNSPKQLQEILYEQMGLPVLKKTATGNSTDASVLEKLAPKYEIARLLLQYRTLEKLLSTYVRSLPTLISPVTQRIHTSFNQSLTSTGRLSSSNPNLQNIPIRSEDGRTIRRAFVPGNPADFILSADYSQIELRLIAHLAQDQNMLRAFSQNEDIHTSTAALIYNTPYNSVTKEQRQGAKAVNFGIIYGISAFGLAENLGISRQDAKTMIDEYFAKFPSIRRFIDATILAAEQTGFVCTEFGRRRPLPELSSPLAAQKQLGRRFAVNTRIQGTAADIIKLAMLRVDAQLATKKSRLLIQVHDELVLEVAQDEVAEISQLVKAEMEKAWPCSVPLIVDLAIGKNWQEIS